jgi:hypothetical protein
MGLPLASREVSKVIKKRSQKLFFALFRRQNIISLSRPSTGLEIVGVERVKFVIRALRKQLLVLRLDDVKKTKEVISLLDQVRYRLRTYDVVGVEEHGRVEQLINEVVVLMLSNTAVKLFSCYQLD